MLVLSRNESEEIIISCPNGERLTVKILRIDNGRVRVGFKGPRHYEFDRQEIRIRKDQKETS